MTTMHCRAGDRCHSRGQYFNPLLQSLASLRTYAIVRVIAAVLLFVGLGSLNAYASDDFNAAVVAAYATPESILAGNATLMTVIVRNTGTETWPAFGPIRLAFEGSRSGARYAPHSAGDRMLLYADVAAGDTYTFQFWATPAQSDTVEHVGMVYDRWIVGMKKIDLYVACGTTECIDRSSLIDIASALR